MIETKKQIVRLICLIVHVGSVTIIRLVKKMDLFKIVNQIRLRSWSNNKSNCLSKHHYLHLCDLSALVVASQNRNSILEAYFQCNQQSDCLDTVVATIDVVTHEQVVGIGRLTANLEKLTQVVELTMNVTADGDRCTHLLHVWLIDQDFFGLKMHQNIVKLAVQ